MEDKVESGSGTWRSEGLGLKCVCDGLHNAVTGELPNSSNLRRRAAQGRIRTCLHFGAKQSKSNCREMRG